MTISNTLGRKETDFTIGDIHGVGAELLQKANVIVGGNAAGKSALLNAMLAARELHVTEPEGQVMHLNDVARALTDNGNLPVHKYPRNKDLTHY